MIPRGDLTDRRWRRLRPHLHRSRTGRPRADDRRFVNGMLWIARTGAPWRDLPERYGKWSSVSSRFYRWRQAGVWDHILAELEREADAAGCLDWELHFVDSTVVRAHQHAAGAKGGQRGQALGRSRGGFSTKVHVRAEGGGRPIAFVLTGGERPDHEPLPALLRRGAVKRRGRGRPRLRPRRLAGDKAYSNRQARGHLRRHGIGAVIPQPKNQRPCALFDRTAYRQRNRVERLVNRLKQFRRIATRYEKHAANYLAMLTLAAVILWL